MKKEIKYTIIIPHFNDVSRLNNLIETIPNVDNIQVIVVDDNSKDSEIDRIKLKANGLLLSNTSVNKGAGACRNIGLREAKGKWLIFADSDDYFLKESFISFDRYYLDDYDVIYFSVSSTKENTNIESDRHFHINNLVNQFINDSNDDIRYLSSVPWAKMIRSTVVKAHDLKFDEVMVANDVMFSVKLGYFSKNIKCDATVVYNVTKSQGSLVTKINKEHQAIRIAKSIEYNRYLYDIGKKTLQIPMLSVLLRYKSTIDAKQFLDMAKTLLTGKQKFFPSGLLKKEAINKFISVINNRVT